MKKLFLFLLILIAAVATSCAERNADPFSPLNENPDQNKPSVTISDSLFVSGTSNKIYITLENINSRVRVVINSTSQIVYFDSAKKRYWFGFAPPRPGAYFLRIFYTTEGVEKEKDFTLRVK